MLGCVLEGRTCWFVFPSRVISFSCTSDRCSPVLVSSTCGVEVVDVYGCSPGKKGRVKRGYYERVIRKMVSHVPHNTAAVLLLPPKTTWGPSRTYYIHGRAFDGVAYSETLGNERERERPSLRRSLKTSSREGNTGEAGAFAPKDLAALDRC